MTKIVLTILLVIAACTVSMWFLPLALILWFREFLLTAIVCGLLKLHYRRSNW